MSQEKKGLPTLAWVAIGCVGLMVVAAIIFSAGAWFIGKKITEDPVAVTARGIAAVNPEIEFVSADKDSKVVVFRNEKTGEEIRVDYKDVENGNLSFQAGDQKVEYSVNEPSESGEGGGITIRSNEGEVKIGAGGGADKLPGWVPVYPGAEVQIGFSSSSDEGNAGIASLKSADPPGDVLDYYEEKLKEEGYEVSRQTFSGGGESAGAVTGNNKSNGRTVNVSASLKGDTTEAALNYNGK